MYNFITKINDSAVFYGNGEFFCDTAIENEILSPDLFTEDTRGFIPLSDEQTALAKRIAAINERLDNLYILEVNTVGSFVTVTIRDTGVAGEPNGSRYKLTGNLDSLESITDELITVLNKG